MDNKKKRTKRDLEQLIAQYLEAQEFARTKGRLNEILRNLKEIKMILNKFEAIHNLNVIVDHFEEQSWVLKEYLTLDEVSAYLNVSRWTVRRLSSEKIIPVYKPLDRIFIKREDLLQWIECNKRMSQEEIEESARRIIEQTKKNKINRSLKRALKRKK